MVVAVTAVGGGGRVGADLGVADRAGALAAAVERRGAQLTVLGPLTDQVTVPVGVPADARDGGGEGEGAARHHAPGVVAHRWSIDAALPTAAVVSEPEPPS